MKSAKIELLLQKIVDDGIFLGLSKIQRWSGNDTIKTETVGGHSFDVVMFVRVLVEEIISFDYAHLKLDVLTYAMSHDFDEVFSGDINHTVKYNSVNGHDIKKELEIFCKSKLNEYFGSGTKTDQMFLESTTNSQSGVKDLVKVADWLSMCMFSKREVMMGNTSFKGIYRHCVDSLSVSCDKSISSIYTIDYNADVTILKQIKQIKWQNYGDD